jgi:amidase
VLTPVLGHTTPALGHLSPDVPFDTLFERLREYVSFTPLANATGAPAISLPMGHTPDQLPVSVQFMGRHGGERTLLDIAFTLEANHPWPLLCDFNRNNLGSREQNTRDSLANPV